MIIPVVLQYMFVKNDHLQYGGVKGILKTGSRSKYLGAKRVKMGNQEDYKR
jgi:hypothetical protein